MSGFILSLTVRQILGRRSTLLLVLLAAIPVLLAIFFRISNPDVDPERWTSRVLMVGLVVTIVLPLTALMLGTSVLGDELEDGTIIYLLTKPLPRWQILLPKLAAAWLVTSALVLTSTLVSGFIALEGDGASLIFGFGVAVVLGAFAYCSVFVLLSVVTSRALITGLVYVFIWEGAITSIFSGTRYLSVRHCTLSIAHWLSNASSFDFDTTVGWQTALIMLVAATSLCLLIAHNKLQELEVRDAG